MHTLHDHFAPKKHVIWDWNGTLLQDLEHAVNIINTMLAEEKLPATTLEQYKKQFGFPVLEYYRVLGFSTEPTYYHELCERFNDYFMAGVPNLDLWPGARETLARVKSTGKLQSILSASEQNLLNWQVKHFGLEHLFDHVTGIDDKKAGSKIDRGHQLMKISGVPPEDTVMIGDTDHDQEVAEALGIDLILVEHGHQCATRLRAIHHTVLKIF